MSHPTLDSMDAAFAGMKGIMVAAGYVKDAEHASCLSHLKRQSKKLDDVSGSYRILSDRGMAVGVGQRDPLATASGSDRVFTPRKVPPAILHTGDVLAFGPEAISVRR